MKELQVKQTRVLLLGDQEVPAQILLDVFKAHEEKFYFDFEDSNQVSSRGTNHELISVSGFAAGYLASLGVLEHYEDQMYCRGDNFDMFMRYLEQPEEVVSVLLT